MSDFLITDKSMLMCIHG